MNTICDRLALDHKHCQDLFALIETGIDDKNWDAVHAGARHFSDAIKEHIRMEENVLFPIFEETIRQGDGPVDILRREHAHLHGILDRMLAALDRLSPADFLLHAESFALLMQQHLMKEEVLIYPLLDKALAGRREAIVHAMTQCGRPDL